MKHLMVMMLVTLLVTGCHRIMRDCVEGSGKLDTETRTPGEFTGIELQGSADVELYKSPGNKLEIHAEDNLIPYIITDVRGSLLIIGSEECLDARKPIRIRVAVEDINEVSLSGSGSIYSEDLLETESMECSISGSGDLEIRVRAREVSSRISGSGGITLSGSTERHVATVTGSGNIRAEKLDASNTKARVTGSGNCYVQTTDVLDARITGSGDVRYSGEPEELHESVTGSGDVRKMR